MAEQPTHVQLYTAGLCLVFTGEPFILLSRPDDVPFVYCPCCGCTTRGPQVVDQGHRVVDEDHDSAWKFAPVGFDAPTREKLCEVGIEDWIVDTVSEEKDGPWIFSGLIMPWYLGEAGQGKWSHVIHNADRCLVEEGAWSGSTERIYEALREACNAIGHPMEAKAAEDRREFFAWAIGGLDGERDALKSIVARCTEFLVEWPGQVDQLQLLEVRASAHRRLGNRWRSNRDAGVGQKLRYAFWKQLRNAENAGQ